MARPPKCRRVEFAPEFTYFKPAGIPKTKLEELILNVEELEAIRLKDREGLEQVDCAERMHISRATFQRILVSARNKIAEAIIEGKAIKVEGGHYCFAKNKRFKCPACQHEFAELLKEELLESDVKCPKCKLRVRKLTQEGSENDD